MATKYCMLEENKICDNCCECDLCDLDPTKICDNCAKCIDTDLDYIGVEIEDIILEDDKPNPPAKNKKVRTRKTE